MRELIALAASYGVRIVYAHIADANGFYDADAAAVKVEISLTPDEKRSVIAHELGHVHYDHRCGDGRNSPTERQARAYAAYLLVHPIDYAAAEVVSADAYYIAEELGVTVEVIDDYRAMCIQRLGERTFSRSASGEIAADVAAAQLQPST